MNRAPFSLAAMLLASACSLAPREGPRALPVAPSWPEGNAYPAPSDAGLPSITYRDVFRDSGLQTLIVQALANNRNLRIAAANIAIARAQYRIRRADQYPQLDLSARATHADRGRGTTTNVASGTGGSIGDGAAGGATGSGGIGTVVTTSRSSSSFSADLGITAFEVDLFGRLTSLTRAEQSRYFATQAAAETVRLALVGDIADAWLNHASDASLLQIAEDTAMTAARSVALTQRRLDGGVAPESDLSQAQQILEAARADVAASRTALAQDANALDLLVGAPVDRAMLPRAIASAGAAMVALPAGLDSRVLLRRPDVVDAEYQLRAANADIGAARAALFPSISLTGLLGFASSALWSLFTGGAFNASAAGNIAYPIFRAGAARAGVAESRARFDGALATYERTVQVAFREVADGLARRGTIDEQLGATGRQVAAAANTLRLADMRYQGGVEAYFPTLDAQRSLYAARRQLTAVQLADASNKVALYRSLGGDATLVATPQGPAPAR